MQNSGSCSQKETGFPNQSTESYLLQYQSCGPFFSKDQCTLTTVLTFQDRLDLQGFVQLQQTQGCLKKKKKKFNQHSQELNNSFIEFEPPLSFITFISFSEAMIGYLANMLVKRLLLTAQPQCYACIWIIIMDKLLIIGRKKITTYVTILRKEYLDFLSIQHKNQTILTAKMKIMLLWSIVQYLLARMLLDFINQWNHEFS